MNQFSSKIETNKENFRPSSSFENGQGYCDPNQQNQSTPTKCKQVPFQNSCHQNFYIAQSPQKRVAELLEKAKDKKTYCSITAEQFLSLSALSLNYFCQSLKNEGANQVFQTVFSMQNLNSLYINLQINEITCLRFEKINYYCQNLTYLKIDLGSNNIGQENGIKSLEDCTKQLTNLKQFYIDLRWNNLTDSNCEQIGSSIKHLQQLEEIGLFLRYFLVPFSQFNCHHELSQRLRNFTLNQIVCAISQLQEVRIVLFRIQIKIQRAKPKQSISIMPGYCQIKYAIKQITCINTSSLQEAYITYAGFLATILALGYTLLNFQKR